MKALEKMSDAELAIEAKRMHEMISHFSGYRQIAREQRQRCNKRLINIQAAIAGRKMLD